MDKNSLSHTKWECKYHLVFAPMIEEQEKQMAGNSLEFVTLKNK